jgi:hypothetical protein
MEAETCGIVRILREKLGFCPDCGMNPFDKDYDLYHNGYCVKCNLCPVCGADKVAWKQVFNEEHHCEVNNESL